MARAATRSLQCPGRSHGASSMHGTTGLRTHPARIWLIRHGQTDWNAAGRVQGHTPTDLNEAGRQQAQRLASILAGRSFAAVISSDLPRAAQTAQVIADALKLKVQQTEALRERSFGTYEGATWEEIRAARLALG